MVKSIQVANMVKQVIDHTINLYMKTKKRLNNY